MNKTYRSIYNERTGSFVAVAENVKARGKRSSSRVSATGGVAAALAAGALMMTSAMAQVEIPNDGADNVINFNSVNGAINFVGGGGSITGLSGLTVDGGLTASQLTLGATTFTSADIATTSALSATNVAVGNAQDAADAAQTAAGGAQSRADAAYDRADDAHTEIATLAGQVGDLGTSITTGTITATSVTTGNSTLDTSGLTIAGGPSVTASGINAGGQKITNVAPGDVNATSNDAVTGKQIFDLFIEEGAGGVRYFHARSARPDSQSIGNESIAIGPETEAHGVSSFAAGDAAITTESAEGAVALGQNATVGTDGGFVPDGEGSVAIGRDSFAAGNSTVALGDGASIEDQRVSNAMALGAGASVNGANSNNATAVGANAQANAASATAVGYGASSTGEGAVAIGQNALADSDRGLAMGVGAAARSPDGVALGTGAGVGTVGTSAGDRHSHIAIGNNAGREVVGNQTIAIGYQAGSEVEGDQNIAVGSHAGAGLDGDHNVAIGFQANRNIGQVDRSSAVGGDTRAVEDASAFGFAANAAGVGAVAIGSYSQADADAVALGHQATAEAGHIALGRGSRARAADVLIDPADPDSIRSSYLTGLSPNGLTTVSVGDSVAGTARRIVNVADGANPTDAVNVNQLQSAQQAVANLVGGHVGVAPDGTFNGYVIELQDVDGVSHQYTSVAAAIGAVSSGAINVLPGDAVIYNPNGTITVAEGVLGTDAVNKSQLEAEVAKGNAKYYSVNSTDTANRDNSGASGVDAMAIGPRSSAANDRGVAVGYAARSQAVEAVAFGSDVSALGRNSTVVGSGATVAHGEGGVAIGRNARSQGLNSVVMGTNAQADPKASNATVNNAIVIGTSAEATADNGIAIGESAEASALRAVAQGYDAHATADDAMAFGSVARATGVSSQASGTGAEASGVNAQASGTGAFARGGNSVATGTGAMGYAANGIALGTGAVSGLETPPIGEEYRNTNSIAIGNSSLADHRDALALGVDAEAREESATAIGDTAKATAQMAMALGFEAAASGESAAAVGSGANASAQNAAAFGQAAQATAVDALAVGSGANASRQNAAAFGQGAQATAADALAVGSGASASAQGAAAVGDGATAVAANASAVGAGARALHAGSVALGSGAETAAAVGTSSVVIDKKTYNFAGTSPVATVSVGDAGAERTLTNVAAGRISATSTDAINGSQLFRTNESVNALANDLDTAGTSVANALGGTSSYNPTTHTVTAGLSVRGNNYTTVQDALTYVGQGWNVSTESGAAANVAPGATVNFSNNDGNIEIARSGTNLTFELADAVTVDNLTANNGVVTNNLTATGVTQLGSNFTVNAAGNVTYKGSEIANLSDGLSFAGNTGGQITKTLGDTGPLRVSGGLAAGEASTGANLRVDSDGNQLNVVMARNLTDLDSITINNGGPVINSGGINMRGNQITNLADGTADNHAVNLGQLRDVEEIANRGWNVSAEGGATANVAPGGTVDFSNDDGNIEIERTGTNLAFNLAEDIDLGAAGSVTTGDTVLDNSGLTVDDGAGNVTTTTTGGTTVSNAAGDTTTVGAGTVAVADATGTTTIAGNQVAVGGANPVVISGDTGTVGGLTNTTFDPDATYTGGIAATQEQLSQVNTGLTTAGLNFVGDDGQVVHRDLGAQLSVTGGATGDLSQGNIGVTRNAAGDGLVVELADDIELSQDGSLAIGSPAGGSLLDADGLIVADSTGLTSIEAGSMALVGDAGAGTANAIFLDADAAEILIGDAAGNATVIGTTQVSVGGSNEVTIDGETGTVGGLSNTTFDPDATYTGGIAATQEQLKLVSDVANAGWNVTDGTTSANIGPNGVVTFEGDSNITVVQTGADDAGVVEIALNENIDLGAAGSVTTGDAVLDNDGLSVNDGAGNGTQVGAGMIAVSDAGGTTSISGNQVAVGGTNPIVIDGDAGTIGGLTNTTFDPDNFTSGQAATEDQLKSVSDVANMGWNVSVDGEGAVADNNVAPGGVVDFSNDDGNIEITRTGTDVAFNLAENIDLGAGGSLTTGDTVVNNDGVTVSGPSVNDPSTTVGAGRIEVAGPGGAGGNTIVIDGGAGSIGGLQNQDIDYPAFADGSGRAATEEQLDQVNQIANAGWNVTDADGNTANIGPNGVVTFEGDSNISVAQTGADDAGVVEIALNRDLDVDSVTAGNSLLDNTGLSVDDGTGAATTVAAGTVTVTANPATGPANTIALDANTGTISVTDAAGNTTSVGTTQVAVGGANPVVISGDTGTIGGLTNTTFDPDNYTSGQAATEDQLKSVSDVANAGWNVTDADGNAANIGPNGVVTFEGDQNISVAQTGVDQDGVIEIALNRDLDVDSVTAGNSLLDNTGLSVDDGAGNATTTTVAGTTVTNTAGDTTTVGAGTIAVTDGAGTTTIAGNQVAVGGTNPIVIDGDAGTIGGLTNTTFDPDNFTSGQAATEDQLKSVSDVANAGWNVTDADGNAANIGPNGVVTFEGDSNISVAQTGVDQDGVIEIALNRDLDVDSVTAGNSLLDNTGLTVDDGTGAATTVAAGTVTVTANPATGPANTIALDANTGTISVADAAGNTTSVGTTQVAVGGANPILIRGDTGTIGGLTNITFDPDNYTSGQAATEDQLKSVSDVANAGWNVTDGATSANIGPNGVVTFEGDSNITVAQTGVDDAGVIEIALNENIDLGAAGSVTTGDAVLDNDGLNVDDSAGNSTQVGAGSISVTDAGGTTSISGNQVAVGGTNPIVIDGDAGTIGGLTNTTFDPDNFTSGQAATEDQLKSVSDVANAGWNVTDANGNVANIGPNGVVTFEGDSNITVAQTGVDDAGVIEIALNENIDLGAAGSVTAGNSVLDNTGLTVDDGTGAATTVAAGTVTVTANPATGPANTIVLDANTGTISVADAAGNTTSVGTTQVAVGGANPILIRGDTGTIGGLTNTTFDPDNYTSGQAATEDQLKSVSDVANMGWNVSVDGEGAVADNNVAPGGVVDFSNDDGNIEITRTGTDVAFNLAENIDLGAGGSLTTGDTVVNNDGVTVSGPSVNDPSTTVGAGRIEVAGPGGAGGNTIVIDGGAGSIGGLQNQDIDYPAFADGSGRAATEEQLDQVNQIANAGWNVTDADGNTANIGPNGVVTFEGDSNISVAQTGADDAGVIEIALNRDLDVDSVTAGNSLLDNTGLSVDDGTGAATAVEAGTVTVTANPATGPANTIALDANTGTITVADAAGTATTISNTQVAVGGANPIVISGDTGTIGGLTNTTFDPDNFTSGQAATEDQLKSVSDVANAGWNVTDGTTSANIGPNGVVTFEGDSNISVAQTGADDAGVIEIALNRDLDVDSVTAGDTVLDNDGLNVDDSAGNSTQVGAGSISVTDAGGTTSISGNQVAVGGTNPIVIDGDTGTIGGLQNQDIDYPAFADGSGRAATEEQLDQVNQIANAGWNVTDADGNAANIGPNGQVSFEGDSNITVAQTGADGAGVIEIALNENIDLGATGSVTTGDTVMDNSGVAVGDDVRLSDAGLSVDDGAGNATTTTVAGTTVSNAAGDSTTLAADGTTVANAAGDTTTVGAGTVAVTGAGGTTTVGGTQVAVGGANPIVISGDTGTIGGLTNTTFDPDNFTSGQAATEDQLKSVSDVANAGWNVTDADGNTANIGPNGEVRFEGDSNITVAQTGADDAGVVEIALNENIDLGAAGSVTTGDTVQDNSGLTVDNGAGSAATVQAGEVTVTANPAAGPANTIALDANTGTITVADATGTATTIGNTQVVVGGTNLVTIDGEAGTVGGLSNTTFDPDATYTGGIAATQEQLKSVSDVANAGWNVTDADGNAANIGPNGVVTFEGDSNITVAQSGADDAGVVEIALNENIDLGAAGSVTTGDTVLDNSGLTVDNGAGSAATVEAGAVTVTANPATGPANTIALDANTGTITVGDATGTATTIGNTQVAVGGANPVVISGDTGTVGGLTNTTFDPDATYTGGIAATQEQLKSVSDVANAGWNVTDVDGNTANIGPNGEVRFEGDSNISVAQSGADDAGVVEIALNENIDLGAAGSVTTGDTVLDNSGVAVGDEVRLSDAGLTVDDGAGNVTTTTVAGTTVANAAGDTTTVGAGAVAVTGAGGTTTVGGTQVAVGGANPIVISGDTGTIGGLTNTTFDPDNFTSGQAATEDQLKSVSDVANAGWNVTDVNGNTANIGPNGEVRFEGDSNISVAQTGADDNGVVEIALNQNIDLSEDGSLTIGDALLNSDGLTLDDGAGNRTETTTAGTTVTNAAGDSTTVGAGTISVADATGTTTIAGNQVAVGGANPIVISGDAGTIGGLTNTTFDPNNFTSGQAATEDQLKQVSDVANAGWNVTDVDGNTARIGPNGQVRFEGDSNISVAQSGADNEGVVEIALNQNIDLSESGSLTIGDALLNNDGLTLDDGAGNRTETTVAGTTVSNAAGDTATLTAGGATVSNSAGDTTTVGAGTISVADATGATTITGNQVTVGGANPIVISGDAGTVSGLSNQSIEYPAFADGSGRAATEEQLDQVNRTASAGWNVTDADGNAANIGPNGQVAFVGDDNVTVTQTGEDGDGVVEIALNDTITLGDGENAITINGEDGSINVGDDVHLGNTGLTIAGGPSVTIGGIDAGGMRITNVAPGVNPSDAVNYGQLKPLESFMDLDGNGTFAYNGDQHASLKDVLDSLHWNVEAPAPDQGGTGSGDGGTGGNPGSGTGGGNAGSSTPIHNGNTVGFTGDGNIVVSKTERAGGDGADIKVSMAKDISVNSITAVKVEAARIEISNGGPIIDENGIDMSGKRITNVAAGVNETDAVNVGQLQQAAGNLQGQVNNLRQDLRHQEKKLSAGVAAAMATAALPQAYLPGKHMMSMAGATWNGETGMAIGFSGITDNGKWVYKLSGNATSRGDYGGAVGVGYQW